MAVNVTLRCEDVRGNAASFVAEVRVYVDETLVETRSHDTTQDVDWSFTIPLDLTGSHTIRVTDVAASGPQEYLVAEQTVDCGAPERSESTTTNSEPSVSTTIVPASADRSTSSTATPELVTSTTPASVAEVSTTLSVTVQTGTATSATSTTSAGSTTTTTPTWTTAVHPPLLPATGTTSGPLVGSGVGFIFAGALALTISTRRFRRSID